MVGLTLLSVILFRPFVTFDLDYPKIGKRIRDA